MNIKIKTAIRANWAQLLCVFVSFFLMAAITYVFLGRIVEKQIYSDAEEVLNTAETTIRSKLTEAKISIYNTSFTVTGMLVRGQSRDEIKAYLDEISEHLAKKDVGVAGFIALYGMIDGEFIISPDWTPPGDFVESKRPWFTTVRSDPQTVSVTSPYIDARTGKAILSAATELLDPAGKSYGIISLDMDISALTDYIKTLRLSEGGYGMLINEDFTILASNDDRGFGSQLQDFSDAFAGVEEQFKSGKESVSGIRMTDPDGGSVIAFYRKLPENLYIGTIIPSGSYYDSVRVLGILLAVLACGSMLLLCAFLIRLSIRKMQSDEESRSKTSFLARMSHEIRTPMNSILGLSDLILREELPTKVHEYAIMINSAGAALLAIINDILDYSKLSFGTQVSAPRDYYFSSLIKGTLNVIRIRLIDKGLDFFVTVDCNIPEQLCGDETRIRQILVNLLNNAIKYTHTGFISLDIRANILTDDKLELVFCVEDSGIGIKSEDLPKLFGDFTRLDLDQNQGIEGTGLGLAIARNLCLAMDGDIAVESTYGSGSVFTATIHQTFTNRKPVALVERPQEKRLLFYDERPSCLQVIGDTMKSLGLAATCARSLADFIQTIEQGGQNYDFAFISSIHIADCIRAMNKSPASVRLVIMMELGESAVFKDVLTVAMPVYSITVANVINGVTENERFGQDIERHFVANDASVLVVDDISTNLRVANDLISHYGIKVDTCKSGAEALELVKKNPYDLVFMDHMMPEMDGVQTTAAIRGLQGPYYKNLPVIALTANVIAEQREMFLANDMSDFLAKPINMKELNKILRKWLPQDKQSKNMTAADAEERGNVSPNALRHLDIEGINVDTGFRQVNGIVSSYLSILSGFCYDMEDQTGQLLADLSREDVALFEIHVHAVKNAARSIGALTLSEFAMHMEELASKKNLAAIQQESGALIDDIRRLKKNIETALSRYADPGADADDAQEDISCLQFEPLKAALLDMDIATIDAITDQYLTMQLTPRLKKIVFEIEQNILLYEYEKAIEVIDQFM